MNNEHLAKLVNQSGFPLQIKLMHQINSTADRHGWKVMLYEHSWANSHEGDDGFIDIILTNKPGTIALLIECKRVLDAPWLFINSDNDQKSRTRAKAWLTAESINFRKCFNWADLQVTPACPEAQFCVIQGQDQKSRPMLERTAANIVSSTEAFATEDRADIIIHSGLCTYISAIVTTAPLFLCDIPANGISLKNGQADSQSFTPHPFIRLRKQLSTRPLTSAPGMNSMMHQVRANQKERTVFIVNAEHIADFLLELGVTSNSLDQHLR